MSKDIDTMIIELSPRVQPVLNSIAGETPNQKIAHLLLSEIRHHLEACERERLELEIKYGLEYADFGQKLQDGELGDEFGYALEMDALRWADLIAEKKHRLKQLGILKELDQ